MHSNQDGMGVAWNEDDRRSVTFRTEKKTTKHGENHMQICSKIKIVILLYTERSKLELEQSSQFP